MFPPILKKISLFLQRLPGIGEKTANRLAFFLLKIPEEDLKTFGQNLIDLKQKIKFCQRCFNLSEEELCPICTDNKRDHQTVVVLENPLDLLAFEQGNIYQGVYHILQGKIDPLNRVSADDLKINELINRLKKEDIKELIIATSPDMEGEATAYFIKNRVEKEILPQKTIKITRLAYGLPIGANLEYADYMTLKKALEGRRNLL
jgi:recombination protein RecR